MDGDEKGDPMIPTPQSQRTAHPRRTLRVPAFCCLTLLALLSERGVTWSAAASAETPPVHPDPPVAEDKSLTADAYRQLGMPAIDKPWSDADYQAAAATLEKVLATDPLQLPRAQSATSGAVFARIFAAENLASLGKSRTDLQKRLNSASKIAPIVTRIASVYAQATNTTKRAFDAELVEATAFNVDFSDTMRRLTDEFVDEGRGDPSQEGRIQARDRTRYNFVAVIDGALNTLNQHNAYRNSELIHLADRLAQSIPKLYKVLPNNAQRDLPPRLEKMANDEADPGLKEAILKIKQQLV